MTAIRTRRREQFRNIDLYPVISSEFTNGRASLDVLRAIAAAGARIVQLREKNLGTRELYRLAGEYRRITAEHDMLLIINDHVDIALAVGADGVHLGQDDLPLPAARRIAPGLLLGCSTHNREEAAVAIGEDADYINIGPLFPTRTKQVGCEALGLDTFRSIAAGVDIPFTVMGGIKAHHLPELLAAGAVRVAMVTEITQAEDITARVKELRAFWHDFQR